MEAQVEDIGEFFSEVLSWTADVVASVLDPSSLLEDAFEGRKGRTDEEEEEATP